MLGGVVSGGIIFKCFCFLHLIKFKIKLKIELMGDFEKSVAGVGENDRSQTL